jgi:hypothetical protein
MPASARDGGFYGSAGCVRGFCSATAGAIDLGGRGYRDRRHDRLVVRPRTPELGNNVSYNHCSMQGHEESEAIHVMVASA